MSPANTQYSNTAACYQYLTQEVLFDEADELGRNTVIVLNGGSKHGTVSVTCALVCRFLTSKTNRLLITSSPYVGPLGGGYCTDDCTDDTTYVGTVEENYFNISFTPYRYQTGDTRVNSASQ